MMPGEVVYKGTTKSGTPYSIRYINEGDAPALRDYINTLSDEHTFIRFQGEHMTLPDEEKYLETQLRKVGERTAVHLLVWVEDTLAGICQIDRLDKIERHIANLGITIAKPYRRKGIGAKLLELALSEASDNIEGLRMVTLGVFANNGVALNIYKRFGFKEYGILPQGILQDGNFLDHVFMYKLL